MHTNEMRHAINITLDHLNASHNHNLLQAEKQHEQPLYYMCLRNEVPVVSRFGQMLEDLACAASSQ
jgi:hypothetical protein